MFCPLPGQHGAFPLFCRSKKFSTKCVYTFRKQPMIFHKLKTQWKVCKSPAAAPVFRVELNNFHWVFNSKFPHILAKALQFVKFKSEL